VCCFYIRHVFLTQSQLECDINTLVDLASYVLQAAYGDYAEYVSFLCRFKVCRQRPMSNGLASQFSPLG